MTIPSQRSFDVTLMVVDDGPQGVPLYERMLGGDGYRVVSVVGGMSAVAMATDLCPELIVLELPAGGDDMATLGELRRHSLTAVIVVLAAIGTIQLARRAMQLGADDFITKPYDPALLKLVLRDGLAARRGGARELPCAP